MATQIPIRKYSAQKIYIININILDDKYLFLSYRIIMNEKKMYLFIVIYINKLTDWLTNLIISLLIWTN